jgi:hypothetical protein
VQVFGIGVIIMIESVSMQSKISVPDRTIKSQAHCDLQIESKESTHTVWDKVLAVPDSAVRDGVNSNSPRS